MAILPILRWPDPVLARACPEADAADPALADLARDMLETMYAAPGRGLAAPQVGLSTRLFVMDVDWRTGPPAPRVFVNPRILAVSEERAVHDEGCLSIPGILVAVERPAEVRLQWQEPGGAWREELLTGFAAICVQHELDHLDGIVTFDRLSAEARAAAEAAYAAA